MDEASTKEELRPVKKQLVGLSNHDWLRMSTSA